MKLRVIKIKKEKKRGTTITAGAPQKKVERWFWQPKKKKKIKFWAKSEPMIKFSSKLEEEERKKKNWNLVPTHKFFTGWDLQLNGQISLWGGICCSKNFFLLFP